MTTLDDFTPVSQVAADGRSRIAFGRAGVQHNDRFIISTRPTGEILLTPLASVPTRELLIWEDDSVRESLLRGLGDAVAGRVKAADQLLDDPPGA